MSNTGFILDTPEQINRFALASLRGRLKLEALGMKGRGKSALSIAKGMGYKGTRANMIATITEQLRTPEEKAEMGRAADREAQWAHDVLTGGETGA